MNGNFTFSWAGLLFLVMLFVPNILWIKNKPEGYTAEHENKVLVVLERIGQILTIIFALFPFEQTTQDEPGQIWILAVAFILMVLYELWWIRYFRSDQTLSDFYTTFFGIPVVGAVLPVLAFLLLGMYDQSLWLMASAIILGIGHIGIHYQHYKELETRTEQK